jgi:hypothetical protein
MSEDLPQHIESCRDYAEWCGGELADGRYDLVKGESPEMVLIVLALLMQSCDEKYTSLIARSN